MKKLHLLLYTVLLSTLVSADNSISNYDKQFFIDTYAFRAISEMDYSGIPASVTLAQAILESGWGRGKVAEGANNYFCIKCHNNWQGETFKAWDDEPDLSCFRKYETVGESFRDHSDFLRNGKRYSPLFQLEKSDFRGWAKGLKACGYATDKAYADKLINLIEEYGLWVFDLAITPVNTPILNTPHMPEEKEVMPPINANNGSSMEELKLVPQVSIGSHLLKEEETKTTTALALPFYFYETKANQAEKANDGQQAHRPIPKRERKIKIRPILPHPNIQLSKRE